MSNKPGRKPLLLMILDGWGYRKETENNANRAGQHTVLGQLIDQRPQYADRDLRQIHRAARRPDGKFPKLVT